MKKLSQTLTVTTALFALGMPSVNAATIFQVGSNADWNSATSWGAAPTAGNDYVTAVGGNNVLRMPAGTGNSTFGGGSLEIVAGTIGLIKSNSSTATINGAFTLSGGTLNFGPDGGGGSNIAANLNVASFIVSASSTVLIGNAAGNLTISAPLTGTGNLSLIGANAQIGDIVSFGGISSYSGAISLGDSGALSLSFGSSNYNFLNSLTIVGTSALRLNSGQILTFNQGDLVDPLNGAVGPGVYTGASLTALGANYTNLGGTIVVNAAIPEPSVAILGWIGIFGLLRRRRV